MNRHIEEIYFGVNWIADGVLNYYFKVNAIANYFILFYRNEEFLC
jgi:hypothetical protein